VRTNGEKYVTESQYSVMLRTDDAADPDDWEQLPLLNNLAQWRNLKGLIIRDIVEEIASAGFSFNTQYINDIENFKRKPSLDFINVMACLYDDFSSDEIFIKPAVEILKKYGVENESSQSK